MSFKKKSMLALAVVGLLGCDLVGASLVNRGGGLIYDTALNITWLQDANFAKSSAYSVDGLMTWADAMSWVSNLNYGEAMTGDCRPHSIMTTVQSVGVGVVQNQKWGISSTKS